MGVIEMFLDRNLVVHTIGTKQRAIKTVWLNCMDWIPTITEGSGSVYMRIVDALSADIASGRLARGQQLPTHRALARALDIDLTTVTRAYGEARRRG